MLCSCLQIQCLKTAAPAPLQHCQGCSRAAALVLPTAAAAVLVNIPGWGWHCSSAARQLCPAHSCSRSSPEDGTETSLQTRLGYTGISVYSKVSRFSCKQGWEQQWAIQGSNPNTSALLTGKSSTNKNRGWLLQSQGGLLRFIHIWWFSQMHIHTYFCPVKSPTSIQSSLSKNPTDVHRNFTCRELSGLSLKSVFLDLFMLLYLLFFENVHDRNTAYKKIYLLFFRKIQF